MKKRKQTDAQFVASLVRDLCRDTKKKRSSSRSSKAPKKLNLAGFHYVGDLLQQLLDELIEQNESETIGAPRGPIHTSGGEFHTGE